MRQRRRCGANEGNRYPLACKAVPHNQILFGLRILLLTVRGIQKTRVIVPPQLDARSIPCERVALNDVVVPMFNRNSCDAAIADLISEDPGVIAITAPNAVIAVVQGVFDELVGIAEGRFDAVGDSVGEIVAIEDIPVASPFARPLQSLMSRVKEESVPAVRCAIISKKIIVALLKD